MVDMENDRLLLIPEAEDEPAVASSSVGLFGCCKFKIGQERRSQMSSTHPDWWANDLSKSMRRATQWSESIFDDAGGKRWKNLVRRVKTIYSNNGQGVRTGRPRFHYDATSYALNFDDGDGRVQAF